MFSQWLRLVYLFSKFQMFRISHTSRDLLINIGNCMWTAFTLILSLWFIGLNASACALFVGAFLHFDLQLHTTEGRCCRTNHLFTWSRRQRTMLLRKNQYNKFQNIFADVLKRLYGMLSTLLTHSTSHVNRSRYMEWVLHCNIINPYTL